MKKNLFCSVMSLALFSCKKDDDKNNEVTPYVETVDVYQPQTTGSYWIYRSDSTQTTNLDTLKATGVDTVVAGKTYKIFKQGDDSKQYFRRSQGNYYQYNFTNSLDGIDDSVKTKIGNINSYELLYLKDNAKLGDVWNNEFKNNYYKYKLEYTVTESVASKVINGVTYNNVIGVTMQVYEGLSLTDVPIGGLEYMPLEGGIPITIYYAKNVGMISVDAGTGEPMNLYKYQIK